jgi:hypothetical protein
LAFKDASLDDYLSGGLDPSGLRRTAAKPDAVLGSGVSQSENGDSPWRREARLAYAAVQSIPEAASEAFSKDYIGETAGKAAISAAGTLALTCISRQAGLAWAAKRVLVPAMAVSSVSDIAGNGADIYGAVTDTWQSDKNWNNNVAVMKNSVGRFAVDMAVSSVGGGLAHVGGSRYFGWSAPGTRGLAELNAENLKIAQAGETTSFKLKSEGVWRRVDVRLPSDFSFDNPVKRNMLIGLDGILVKKNPGMAGTNGLAALADETGSIGAFAHAGSFRLVPGVRVSSWQSEGAGFLTPGSWLVPKAKIDDARFVSDVNARLKGILKTNETTLVGFSEGGNAAHHIAAKLGSKEVQGLAVIEGTLTGIEAKAVPGMRTIVVHGTEDPTIPLAGGAGGLTEMLGKIGHKRMANSNPLSQVSRYTTANEFHGQPVINKSDGVTEFIYPASQSAKGGEVRYYQIEGGRHAYPNRSVGKAEDKSVLSGFNGGPSSFNVNAKIGEHLLAPRVN